MYSKRIEQVNLNEVFPGPQTSSVGSLLYLLQQLNGDSNPPLDQTISIVYKTFMQEVDDDRRLPLFQYLVQQVESCAMNPDVILAIVKFETNHFLVNRATGAFIKHKQASFERPFAAVEIIADLIVSRQVANRGAVFAGLICLGDRRVCAVARSIRDCITVEDARAFSRAAAGPLQASTIEFCMEWMHQLIRDNEFELAIQVAYGLSSLVINDATLMVNDACYNFGPFGFTLGTISPQRPFGELLTELAPLVEQFSEGKLPAINRMIEILKDPASHSLDRLDQRKVRTRRTTPDRRVSDRRIVDIAPRIERRNGQRRSRERRIGQRR